MNIALQVEPQLAVALNTANSALEDARNLLAIIHQAHATLEPLDAAQSDPDLSRYFNVKVPDEGASALQDALLATKGVTAAYLKPAAEIP